MKNLKIPKLSKRLLEVANLSGKSERFYDLCCDHGKLGEYILKNSQSRKVIFVDPVEKIISSLKNRISDLPKDSVEFKVEKAQEIKYLENSVISIAGVGVHMAIEILNICKDVNGCSFILNANGDPLILRKYLVDNKFRLDKEVLVYENRQFYEIMKVGKNYTNMVTFVGDSILYDFDSSNDYLRQRISEVSLRSQFNDDSHLILCLDLYRTKSL